MPRKASLAFAHPNVLGAPTYMVLALAQLDAQSAYMVRSIVFAIGAGTMGAWVACQLAALLRCAG